MRAFLAFGVAGMAALSVAACRSSGEVKAVTESAATVAEALPGPAEDSPLQTEVGEGDRQLVRLEEQDYGLLATDVVRRVWGEGDWIRKPERDDEVVYSSSEIPSDWRGKIGVRYAVAGEPGDEGTSVRLTQRVQIDLGGEPGAESWQGEWKVDREHSVGESGVIAWRFGEHQPRLSGTFTFSVLQGEETLLERTLTVLSPIRGDDSGDIFETTLPSGLTFRMREYGLFGAKPEMVVPTGDSSYGGVLMLDDLRHVGTTAEVPLKRVDYFGYFFDVEGPATSPPNEAVPYTVRIVHPEWYNRFRDERSTVAHWELAAPVGGHGMALERLLFPYMKVPGEYYFEIWHADELVLRKRFDVYVAESGSE